MPVPHGGAAYPAKADPHHRRIEQGAFWPLRRFWRTVMDPKEQNTSQVDAPAGETKPAVAALIVFGLDDVQKPHASWFDEADAPLAEKAAGLMGMKILRLTTNEQRGLAGKLPKGRVFGSGKCFVPFTNKTLYSQLRRWAAKYLRRRTLMSFKPPSMENQQARGLRRLNPLRLRHR
jgi:hypothetical protein